MTEQTEQDGKGNSGANPSPPHTGLDDRHLGIAGRMTRQFINSPVTPLLMMAFLAIGLIGLFFTPRQEDPKISVPMVDIFVQYPGATAEQVVSLVTDPLQRIVKEIPGVRHVYAASQREAAIVTVRFFVGEELEQSIVKVHDKLQSNLDKMPPGVPLPLVKPVGIDDVPIVTATLWSQDVDDAALRTLSLDVLQRLNEVPNTGKGFVVGGRTEQIRVEVMPERLSGFGISPDVVANTIQTANSEQSAGSVEGADSVFNVYTGAFLRNAQEIGRLVVGTRQGSPIYVSDVARVFQGPEETKEIVTMSIGPAYAGDTPAARSEPAVTIAMAKKIGSNGVTVADAILKKLESLRGQLIPDNVHVTITRNYGQTANDKVNELLKALFEAAVAVAILCLIGLGARAAFVVITVIPIVILVTVWSAWVLDYTVDRVSLFALVFAIGILVDDATVVVENIFRRWLAEGATTVETAIDAVREVGNPTILATLTIIAALLPMGFVSGLMGPYMRPIPVLGSSAMSFSLLAAFMFTPWFAMRVRPQLRALKKAERREEKVRAWIGRVYRPLMRPLIESRTASWAFLIVLVGATFIACAMFYTQTVPVKMLPFDNKPEFNVVVNMPEGTALPVTANVTQQLARELEAIPEVTAIQTYAGTASPFNFNGMVRHYYLRQQPWEADIQVMLLDKKKRERPSHVIAVDARTRLARFFEANPAIKNTGVQVQVVEMPPGPPVLQTVVAEVYGPDGVTRRQFTYDLTRMFAESEGVVDVDNYMAEPHDVWRFEVDIEKSVRRGVSVDTINRNLDMAMGGYRLGDVKRGVVLEPTYIVIQVPLSARSQVNRLKNLPIPTSTGRVVPLAELGDFVRAPADPYLFHKDLRRIEYVTGEMQGRLGAPIYGMFNVEDRLEKYTSPDGVKVTGMPWGLIGPPEDNNRSGFEWGGEWTVTYETFRDMGMAFMAALLLIYGLIVWEFKNFKLGGLIMGPIPLTLIGIIPGHWIVGAEFTATSMIGFIALAGIIVRNSILLVEFVKNEVASGKDIREAVVDAGATRMRPIFITAFTLMAGAAAILFDPIFQGMAVSLLFGTGVATVLTLVAIPLGCISYRKQFYLLTGTAEVVSEEAAAAAGPQRSFGLALWQGTVTVLTWVFYIARALLLMLKMAVSKLWQLFSDYRTRRRGPGTPPGAPSGPGGAPAPAGPGPAAASGARAVEGTAGMRGRQAASASAAAPKPRAPEAPAEQAPARAASAARPAEPPAVPADTPVERAATKKSVTAGAASGRRKKASVSKSVKKRAAADEISTIEVPKKKPRPKSAAKTAPKASAKPAAKESIPASAGGTEEAGAPAPRKRRGIRLSPDLEEFGDGKSE